MSKFWKVFLSVVGAVVVICGAIVGIMAILGKLYVISDFFKKLSDKIKSIDIRKSKPEKECEAEENTEAQAECIIQIEE